MKKQDCRPLREGELSAFCLQLSLMLEASMTTEGALDVLLEGAASQEETALLASLDRALDDKKRLWEAMAATRAFPLYAVQMTKLGEETGTLDLVMRALAEEYRKRDALRAAVRSALLYPSVTVCMLLAVLLVLFVKVVPVFEGVYAQMGASLSETALVMISAGTVILEVLLAVFLLLTLVLALGGLVTKLRGRWAAFLYRRSRVSRLMALRQLTAVLASAIKTGLSLERALELAGELIENPRVAEAVKSCQSALDAHGKVSDALRATGLFSPVQVQMLGVGSRAGKLDVVLETLEATLQAEAEEALDRSVSRLEPALVAVLTVTVGVVLLSVMLPLAGMLSGLGA